MATVDPRAGVVFRRGREPGQMILVAGPCSVESQEQVMETALGLKGLGLTAMRGGIWKPRTRPDSFQGVGAEGLAWLTAAGRAAGLPVTCEVAEPAHVELCLEAGVDILWIGARTTVNPFSVQAIADCLKGVKVPVMVKNPINPDLGLWIGAVERLEQAGLTDICAIHRGFSIWRKTPYRNEPIWRIPLDLRRLRPELALLCDPSHICGRRDLLGCIAQEAIDLLYDGLMVEVHAHPEEALSDSEQQITPPELAELLSGLEPKKPTSPVREYRSDVEALRTRIDEIDHQLLDLLGRRMATVREISDRKKKYAVASFQPDRWQEIVASRTEYGAGVGLPEDFVLDIFQRVHEEAIRQQAEGQAPSEVRPALTGVEEGPPGEGARDGE
jgi:chorismate mutase